MAFTYVVCSDCFSVNKVLLEKARQSTAQCGRCSQALNTSHAVQELSPQGFRRLIEKSPLPVAVDFWAPWCGPCRAFAPTFAQVAEKWAGRMVFAKLNTQDFPEISSQLGIRGIPTLAIFHKNQELARQSGAMAQPMLENWLKPHLRESATSGR